MRMIATVRVESDDGRVAEQSVSSVGVDTRVKGIDPDAAKEDFIAQARGLLTSIGETHVPALYATVQDGLEATAAEPEEPEQPSAGAQAVTDKLKQIRARRAGSQSEPSGAGDTDVNAETSDATEQLKGQV